MKTNKEFRMIRDEIGLTQHQAAEALERSTSWVRAIEKKSNPIPCPRYAVLAMRYLLEHPDKV